jgi:hypothetical protein
MIPEHHPLLKLMQLQNVVGKPVLIRQGARKDRSEPRIEAGAAVRLNLLGLAARTAEATPVYARKAISGTCIGPKGQSRGLPDP